MSYNLVNPTTGALTRVAGRGKAEYGASSVRSGTYIPSGPVKTQDDLPFSVTFSEPMPDNDYQVIFGSSSYGAASGTIQCVVRSRSTTGFTGIIRNVGQDEVSVASGTFTWFAFKLYSDVEYSNIVNSMPSDASASNKLVTESDTNSTTLTSTDSLASWAGNAKGVMTAFIGASSKPSDIGAPLSSWGETMIWCIGDGIRKTLFAVDYSVLQQVIYTRKYFNGSFITDWTAIKDGNLTSSVTPGSTAPITSGGVANVAGYCGQYTFDTGISIVISMESTAFRRVTIYQDYKAYSFIVHEWGGIPMYHWILGTELPSGITASYSGYKLTFTNNSYGTARMIIEAPSNPVI